MGVRCVGVLLAVATAAFVCRASVINAQLVPGLPPSASVLPRRPPAGSTTSEAIAATPALDEASILLDFKASLKNESQALLEGSPWNWTAGSKESYCNWGGVQCINGYVSAINLTSLLLGPAVLPAAFANLTELRSVILDRNLLQGGLPTEWASLSALVNLTLSDNQLYSTLPPAWGQLTSLERLELQNNHLFLKFPPAWGGMSSLKVMYLRNNTLIGALPAEWEMLTNLRIVDLSSNLQGGERLPPGWANLVNLTELYLGGMRISGPLPEEWAQAGVFPKLKFLYINNNTLTGTLPASWFSASAFPSLKYLALELNRLHGTIPPIDIDSSLVAGGTVTLVPQSDCDECGFCGAVPQYFNIIPTSGTGPPIYDLGTACTSSPPSGSRIGPIIGGVMGGAFVVGSAVGLAVLIIWIRRRKRKRQRKEGSSAGAGEEKGSSGTTSPLGVHNGGGTPNSAPSGGQSGDHGNVRPSPRASNTAGEGQQRPDSALTLHAGTGPSWAKESGDLGPGRLADVDSDALNVAAYQLSIGEVRPEDVELEINGKKRLIGRGSFGEVYLGTWQHTQVAVKFLIDQSEEQQVAFRREAELLRSLRHPNIVSFLGCCMQPGKMMVVTEYLPGGNLRKAMKNDSAPRHLGWGARGLTIAMDVAKGVAFLHHHRVIHFDIKSGNVLLTKTGQAKVSDVGLSKLTTGSVTQLSVDRGTFDYMAPELFLATEASVASDTYSFGVLMHEIITGEAPDRRRGFRHPRVPEECSQEAVDLMYACMASAPSSRPKMSHVVERLIEFRHKRDNKNKRSAPARVGVKPPPVADAAGGPGGGGPEAAVSPFADAADTPFAARANSAKPAIATNSGLVPP